MPHDKVLPIDPNERVELIVRRTSIGLIPFALAALISFAGLIVAVVAILSNPEAVVRYLSVPMALAVAIGLGLLIGLILVASIFVYVRNQLIVTNENVIQVLYFSLFSRRLSQLSLAKVQDITVNQHGLIATMFNYGTLFIETAGEEANFEFPLARDPHVAAKRINEAHDAFVKSRPHREDF